MKDTLALRARRNKYMVEQKTAENSSIALFRPWRSVDGVKINLSPSIKILNTEHQARRKRTLAFTLKVLSMLENALADVYE